jgi:predicted GIY-YIG superfamily endonuclease
MSASPATSPSGPGSIARVFCRASLGKYGVKRLVYYEFHATMEAAIRREKQIKEWRRAWKIELIESVNRNWRDLFGDLAL